MKVFLILFLTMAVRVASAQQNYNDFEGNCHYILDYKSGRLNSKAKNPEKDTINNSKYCAKYSRASSETFDNIKLLLKRKLEDVSVYANYSTDSPKIKMKVYSSSPPGTLIEIQLGKKTGQEYPACIHSQYQVKTTKENEWEELEFSFSQIPKGSRVKSVEVNQIIILFAPGVKEKETFYFDDLTGPLFLDQKIMKLKMYKPPKN
ncbi:MAG: hypothetical protein M3Q58_13340 [Bacteroidota bacterium]|nr:hypothetical protein [Bacteroidota bacterium]